MLDGETHILVVDDDDRLRDLLRRFLGESGYRVSTAANAGEARSEMAGMRFDLVVLDVMMPGEQGLDMTRDLRRTDDTPILLLTALGDAADRISGLESGADDYLAKPFEPKELVLRIEAILRRTRAPVPAAESIRLGDCAFDLTRGELQRGGDIVHLTPGEADLLRIFARNPGVTIDRSDLLRLSNAGTLRAVDVQITRLRRKLEPDPKNPHYLKTVWGQGYTLWPD